MKKLITTASVAALGAVSLQAAYAPGLTEIERSKPWSVSATLRGFYDDNYTTSPDALARDSFGFEISPSISFNTSLDQTLISASYVYGMKYYEDRTTGSADHSHQFNGALSHAFTERHKIDLSESFVVAQEPSIIEPPGPAATFLRSDGDNIRNLASINYTGELTRVLSLLLGYQNSIYDYEQGGPGGRSAVLDRLEHLATINLRWQAIPTTIGVLGYQFGVVDHTSNDSLDAATPFTGIYVDPEVRDNISHYVYVGVDHTFTHQLNASVRVGGQFTEYNNALPGMEENAANPYADASLTWTYNPGSFLQAGIRHSRYQTDVAFFGGALPTLDQEVTALYASVNHRITPKLTGRLMGQWQSSGFQGGAANDQDDQFWMLGASLGYQINQWLAAEAGYNYDKLDSDLAGRSFDRNRIFIGLRATY